MNWAGLDLYARPALQFSGGKDSLACLLLLREAGLLDRITVYWLNAGDGCPENLAAVEWARSWVPKFVEVRSDALAWRRQFGDPSDVVPASAHTLGVAYGLSERRLVNRFDCCWFNLMVPMHERMLADGVDAVIRGTKLADTGRLPAEGPTVDYDILLPLRDWTHRQVFDYLAAQGAPVNPIYEHTQGMSAPECLTCTAWWDDGKAAYLRARHPERLTEYRASLEQVRQALRSHLADLDRELEN